MSRDEHVRAIHERRERAERHVFLAMATVFALLALVAWHPQHADLGLWIIGTPLILALGGLIVWIAGTFLALPLDAYYERRDKKHEGFGPAQGGGWCVVLSPRLVAPSFAPPPSRTGGKDQSRNSSGPVPATPMS